MRQYLRISLMILAVAASGSVRASDIRIDLSNSVSTTAGNWNNIGNLTGLTSNLIDFPTGAGTGVSIDGSGSPWNNFFGDDFGTFPNQDWLIQPATADGAGLSDGLTGVFRFSGLTDASYQVEIVSARTEFNYLNTITVDGGLANRTYLGTAVNTPWGSTSDGLTPGNWLIWDNIAPVSGSLTVQVTASPNTLGMINAIRLVSSTVTPVPEPGTLGAALSAAVIGLVVWGRGRRTTCA